VTMAHERKARLPADRTSAGPLPAGVGAPARTASVAIVAGFAGLVACLLVFGTLAEDVRSNEVFALDTFVTPLIHGVASPTLDFVMNFATTLGSNLVIPPLFVAEIAILLWIRRPGAALFQAVVSGGALLLNGLMKVFFHRPRPILPWAQALPDFSFPSGHTMNAFACYVGLAIVIWSIAGRRWGLAALTSAFVIVGFVGLSRIYLGVHYPTDVLGAVLAGTIWVLVVLAAFRSRPLSRFWFGSSAGRTSEPSSGAGAG
jgi:undecaprenyl-diphosphatase